MLDDWLLSLEERLDPVLLFERFVGNSADGWQARILRSSAATMALRVCRQAGKSCCLATLAIVEMRKGGTVLVICPAERQAKELARKVREYLPMTDLVVERSTQTEIEVANGARLICVPSTGATIRGYTVDLLLIDEAAFCDDDSLIAVLPMVKDCGRTVFASTPAGRTGMFASLFLEPKPEVERIVVKGTEIPRLAARVERLRVALPPTKFRQEVEVEMLGGGENYFDIAAIERAVCDRKALELCLT
ncbi:terminase large subunit domain-containing protein [Alteraurantiacibacter aquimixticola]|uniref:TcmA/NAT10 helicase domain-containing protein n=1 Tax=Alteraurantiacibacter aquimixticola TaxID=2489173 RepID=A0A4T3EWC9_9SPHN|nr:terminase family protein [Alteraurantiacibacter aquimixticola]TIX48855.1 hypothetical protein E5222_14010 [Alteraurantiacibacter aquimixticola]